MNTTDYIAEAERQLNNPDYYEKLQKTPNPKIQYPH